MEPAGPPSWDTEQWRQEAACRQGEVDLFFPAGSSGPAEVQIARAKAVCGRCGVQAACLEFALGTNQEYGVWGAASEEERRVMRRARRAARLARAS